MPSPAPVSFTRPAPLRRDREHGGRRVLAPLRSPSRDRLHCGQVPSRWPRSMRDSSGLLHETGSIAAARGSGACRSGPSPPVSFTRPAPLRRRLRVASSQDLRLRSPSRDRLHCGAPGDGGGSSFIRTPVSFTRPAPLRRRTVGAPGCTCGPSGLLHETGSIAAVATLVAPVGAALISGLLHETGSIAARSRRRMWWSSATPPVSFTRPAPLRQPGDDGRWVVAAVSGLLHETGSIAAILRQPGGPATLAPVSFTRPAPLRPMTRTATWRRPGPPVSFTRPAPLRLVQRRGEVVKRRLSGLLHETGSIAAPG